VSGPGYRLVSVLGLAVMLGIAWAISENRRAIRPRIVLWGVGLQLCLALLVLKTPGFGDWFFAGAQKTFNSLIASSDKGAAFLFGPLTTQQRLLAFTVLPIVIFVSSVSGVLYHLGIIQAVVRAMARLMHWTMKISGAESVAAALFIFLGIESVTAIGKYIKAMTRSELFVVMTAFLATIASSVMGAYVSFGASAGHLLAASLMSAPAAVVVAKIMIPETGRPATAGGVEFEPEITTLNVVDAAASGAADGVRLAINIGAMLIAFVGIIALLNTLLGYVGTLVGLSGLSLERMFSYVFSPLAVLMGVPPEDAFTVGELLGTKTVLNEFFAYSNMQGMIQQGMLTSRSVVIATYALCGFANFGSIAILIGGIGSIVPGRRSEVAALGLKALVAGTLAAFMTACFAGALM